jgi:very-short-patch-repair endonuclease
MFDDGDVRPEEFARLIDEAFADKANRDEWHVAYREARSDPERWNVIRDVYRVMMPVILKASEDRLGGRVDPYFVSWKFTPIEALAWMSIREVGLPVYPQVPAHRWFIDFANPYHRIGVELDGKDYHDPVTDTRRDSILAQQRWHIYRITGAEAYRVLERPHDMDREDMSEEEFHRRSQRWWNETSDGVITAIDRMFFRPQPERWEQYDYMLATLYAHRLVL